MKLDIIDMLIIAFLVLYSALLITAIVISNSTLERVVLAAWLIMPFTYLKRQKE